LNCGGIMKIFRLSKTRVTATLAALLLIPLLLGFGCGKQVPTPTPTLTPTPTSTPLPKIQVIIYSDFQCLNCEALFFNVEEELLRLYGNTTRVSIEVRPINGFGDASLLSGEAALCAKDQGKFWEYANALFISWSQVGASAYSEGELIKTAVALGLNQQAFSSCLTSGTKAAEVEANKQILTSANIFDVPVVLINQKKIVGLNPLQTYVDAINEMLSK
jgi:protein-disulfide isomerase